MMWANKWSIAGSFSVDGTLKSGSSCCATGELSSIAFSDSRGFTLGLDMGALEFVMVGFQNTQGRAVTTASICVDGFPDSHESAVVDIQTNWHLVLLARGTVLESRIGPFVAETGWELGLFGAGIEIRKGVSASAVFDINEDIVSIGGVMGSFVSVSCNLGTFQAKSVLDVTLKSLGRDALPITSMMLSVGVGFGF